MEEGPLGVVELGVAFPPCVRHAVRRWKELGWAAGWTPTGVVGGPKGLPPLLFLFSFLFPFFVEEEREKRNRRVLWSLKFHGFDFNRLSI